MTKPMGQVELWLEGPLSKFAAGNQPIVVDAGQTIREILQALEINANQPVAALVNGVTSDLNVVLKAGDQVRIIPLISGG